MGRLKIIISVFLILVVGFLAGAIGSRMLIQHRIEKHFLADELPGIRFLNRLTDRLDLSEPQSAAIHNIIETSRKELLTYRQKYRPEFQKLFDETLSKVNAELNESQKKKLDRFSKKIKRRTRRMRHGPPHKPPIHLLTPDELINELNIDDAHKKDVHALLADHMAEKEKIAKSFIGERRQMMHQHKSEMEKLDRRIEKQLKVILSPDQLKTFQRLMEDEKPPRRPFFKNQ
jgi:hypothetical protein